MDLLDKLHINIPFVEALEQMPPYLTFLKDILSKKMWLVEFEIVALTKECNAIIQNKLALKRKDPNSFMMPSTISALVFTKALSDLRAISVVDSVTSEVLRESHPTDPYEASLIVEFETSDEIVIECVNVLNALFHVLGTQFEVLDFSSYSSSPMKLSIEELVKLELKPLLNHLSYAYLGDLSTLPVIILSDLYNN
ncbi:PREDICTED: uncharacterized protein LOC108661133 [Theobroma cacao]|uniref:Uncharacterized protein LOC108661133 n=1 Tax=Theobroma cacao TaxID=3641 RepID=A0AB32W2Y5_THECC|nr:PREDICTED: uncharacterized protein LOC108661133 [Theobroma cacao]